MNRFVGDIEIPDGFPLMTTCPYPDVRELRPGQTNLSVPFEIAWHLNVLVAWRARLEKKGMI